MTQQELNYIKDAFSQIIDDIAGNPDWNEAARAVASDLGTLERKLEKKISPLPSNLDKAAEEFGKRQGIELKPFAKKCFKSGVKWISERGISMPAHIFMPSGIKSLYNISKGEYPAAVHLDCGGSLVLERMLKNFNHREEVIVQIRKKE